MVSPPVTYTMASHSREVLERRRTLMRFAGLLVLMCLFFSAIAFSYEFFSQDAPRQNALSAATAEALAAENAFDGVSLLAQGAIVVNIDNGAVLYELNPDAQLPLASLVKVPLVLVAAEVLSPESILALDTDTRFNSRASQLLTGERWRTKDLMAYTLVASSNDGAEILARAADEALRAKHPESTGSAAVWRMNDLVRGLNLTSIYFLNPTGLDESQTLSGAYGSARDVAALFAYAHAFAPGLFLDTATSSITISSLDGRPARATNTDEALDRLPGLIMGKTGLTDLAGGNLAVLFEANGRRYAAVVLGSTEDGRFSDIAQLGAATRSIYGQ